MKTMNVALLLSALVVALPAQCADKLEKADSPKAAKSSKNLLGSIDAEKAKDAPSSPKKEAVATVATVVAASKEADPKADEGKKAEEAPKKEVKKVAVVKAESPKVNKLDDSSAGLSKSFDELSVEEHSGEDSPSDPSSLD